MIGTRALGPRRGRSPRLAVGGLPTCLSHTGCGQRTFAFGDLHRKGYLAEDFADAWGRYLDPSQAKRDKRDKRDIFDNQ